MWNTFAEKNVCEKNLFGGMCFCQLLEANFRWFAGGTKKLLAPSLTGLGFTTQLIIICNSDF